MKKISRRDAIFRLGSAGIAISLPLLESMLPFRLLRADGLPSKKRFIGCFFPSGAAMPDANNGDWTWVGALNPIVQQGVKNNVLIARGFRSVNLVDVHWSGTASFLSCNEIGLWTLASPDRRAGERCGKSFDQYVADLERLRAGSLHAGWNTVPGWDEGHDSQISIQYVNTIAWRDERSPIQHTKNPLELFTRVFGDGTPVADPQIQYLLKRRKSILDGVLGQLKEFRSSISSPDRTRMDSFEQGIREVEQEISSSMIANTCDGNGVKVSDPSAYIQNFRTMQKVIIKAFQCNVSRSATIMYHEGIGDLLVHPDSTFKQHDAAHNNWVELQKINRVQIGLWAELIRGLRDAGVLDETVVVLGSNMSDGRSHNAANIPLLVASGGTQLRLGEEVQGSSLITSEKENRPLADLYVDLFKLFGITKADFGEGKDKSTGRPSGILKA